MAKTSQSTNTVVSAPTKQFVATPRFEVWKPKKDGTGHGAVFEVSQKNDCFFLKMMPQTGLEHPVFDSKRSVSVKLGANDVGEILGVLVGISEGLGKKNEKGFWGGLYHKSATGSSTITLSRGDYGFILGISVKRENVDASYRVGLTTGEVCLLKVYLEKYLPMFFNSNNQETPSVDSSVESTPF
jgi:hypothetical protein